MRIVLKEQKQAEANEEECTYIGFKLLCRSLSALNCEDPFLPIFWTSFSQLYPIVCRSLTVFDQNPPSFGRF